MSSMFGGGFKATKCKTLLRLAMARIKLLRNKRDIQIKQMRKDIAHLLSTGQEPSARIRVEHIAREQNIMAAYDIIELFCELVIVRLPIIESQKVCPMDLKEAVSSLIFASPRCADLPELLQIRGLFTSKYGKEFVACAAELRPECGVNRRIIEKLSVRAPSGPMKLKLLTEIAAEHNVNWDPADSEAELMKQPEDLLDGHKKFFSASEAPNAQQPSPPKQPEQSAPTVPPAPAPAPAPQTPAPPSTRAPIQMNALYSSEEESEEDTPSGEKKQFIPFVGPVPPKGMPVGKTQGSSASVSSSKGAPQAQTRKEGPMDYEQHGDYDDVAAAAKAAAESADRAVAAARAAAELAKTHPSKREPLSSNPSKHVAFSEEESEEEDEDEDEIVESKRTPGRTDEPEKSVGVTETIDPGYDDLNPFYRSNSIQRQEDESFRRSNSDDYNEGRFGRNDEDEEANSFPRTNYSEEDVNSVKRVDPEKDSFWRSGDQDWRQAANFVPERKFDSGGFYPDEQRGVPRRDSDLFTGSKSNSSVSKLFSSNDSARDLFKSGSTEPKELRNSDEGFATPKFDDDEEVSLFSKPSTFTTDLSFKRDLDYQRSNFDSPKTLTTDLSFKGDVDYQRSNFDSPKPNFDSPQKPEFKEFWHGSSFPDAGAEEAATPKMFGDDYRPEKQISDSYTFDTHGTDSSQNLSRGVSDPLATKSYFTGDDSESPRHENQSEASPKPKSRRTRRSSAGRDNLDSSGGSGSLPLSGRLPKYSSSENLEGVPSPDYPSGGSGSLPPSGRLPKYSSSENFEAAPSPDYPSSFDDSSSFPPRTSSSFYSSRAATASTPPERTPPSVSSAYESPQNFRESSPPVRTGSGSQKSSPGLSRRDSPSAPAIHPKLPDYDDLTARFEALKGKTRR